jgi:hypothetical protein
VALLFTIAFAASRFCADISISSPRQRLIQYSPITDAELSVADNFASGPVKILLNFHHCSLPLFACAVTIGIDFGRWVPW